MTFRATSLHDLIIHDFDTVIDVRSPSEFDEDHIPGAINLPVLSDEERARVGTIYVQESAFLARKIGAALVARNAATHIEGPLANKEGGWRPLVYCWRGGQRSGSFAAILGQIGWRLSVLEGGYRAWRRMVKACLYDEPVQHRFLLLDGNTGTAKTNVIGRLKARGIQTIDLEGLANHRGSALGAQGVQPTQKIFESRLAETLTSFDPQTPTIVEAESSKIGSINLPPSLFNAMKSAPRIEISAGVDDRARYLVGAYSDMTQDVDAMLRRLDRLVKLRGKETVAGWKELAMTGNFEALAHDLIIRHYDPRYAKVRARVGGNVKLAIDAESLDEDGLDRLSDQITKAIKKL